MSDLTDHQTTTALDSYDFLGKNPTGKRGSFGYATDKATRNKNDMMQKPENVSDVQKNTSPPVKLQP